MLKAAVGCVVLSLQAADALHEPACCARHNTQSTLLCRMCLIRDGHFGAPRTSSRHISLRGGRSEILDEKIENGKTQIQSEQLKEAHVVMRGVLTILAFTSFSSLLVLLIPFGGALFEFPSDNLFPVGQSCVMNVHIMARYTHSIHTSSHQHTHSKHYDAMNSRAHTHPRALSFSLSYTQPGPLLLAKLKRY
jgi:hypothetical protein